MYFAMCNVVIVKMGSNKELIYDVSCESLANIFVAFLII